MTRIILTLVAIVFAVTGCGRAPETSSAAASGSAAPPNGGLRPVQASARPEITPEKIMKDVVGRAIKVSEMSGRSPPTEWTFEADEFKQADILEKHVTDTEYMVVIFMTTRNNHRPNEDDVQVSGKLQLFYQWRGGVWVLTKMGNLTFRYSVGQST